MTLAAKVLLAATGLVGGGFLARAVLAPRTSARRSNRGLRASRRAVTVGSRAGAGTQDWWLGRNERRRNKHLRMMTAKG